MYSFCGSSKSSTGLPAQGCFARVGGGQGLRSLGACLLVLLSPALGRAADEKDPVPAVRRGVVDFREQVARGGVQVVIVGVRECADPKVSPRRNAENDARALYELFANKEVLGGPAANIQLLLGKPNDKSEKATRENVVKALHKAVANAGDDDLVVFAFIGQAASLGANGSQLCYFTSDSTLAGREDNALTDRDVARELDRLGKAQLCVFLDVFFKGFDGTREDIPDPDSAALAFRSFGKSDATDNRFAPGRCLFLATEGLTAPPDVGALGLYTKALLAGLGGEADSYGYEADGLVTAYELANYLQNQIPKLHARHKQGGKSLPTYGFFGPQSDFPLVLNPPAAARAEQQLRKLEDAAKKRRIEKEVLEEGRALLGRMPRLEVQRDLRKDLQAVLAGDLGSREFSENRRNLLERLRLKREDGIRFADKVLSVMSTLEENYVRKLNAGELAANAVRGLYNQADEPIPEEIGSRLRQARTQASSELRSLLADARQQLGNRETLASHKDVDAALQTMLSRLDPLTSYYGPAALAQQQAEIRGHFTGIGVRIQADTEADYLRVVSPIRGSPAYKAGIQSGDRITTITLEVDGEGNVLSPPEETSTKGMTTGEAVKKMLGKAGTEVKLTVQRPRGKTDIVTIRRNRVAPETLFGVRRKADDSWDYLLSRAPNIGYVRLSAFTGNTAEELKKTVNDLVSAGMKGLILDLRFNTGGTVQNCQDVADLFINDETILVKRGRTGEEHRVTGAKEGSLLDFPMVCLVNTETASGSELVAACLQDNKRAVIMGERTTGAASIQTLLDFDGGVVRYTTELFLSPSGRNLDRAHAGNKPDEWGVLPEKGYTLNLSRVRRGELREYLNAKEVIPRKDGDTPPPVKDFEDRQLSMALRYMRAALAEK
jgi:carboxyl-terminal processing protease